MEKLPGPEFLQQKSGTKEGQNQLIKEADGSVAAYSWSGAAQQWVKVSNTVHCLDMTDSSGRHRG